MAAKDNVSRRLKQQQGFQGGSGASLFGSEILPRPSARLCTHQPGWSIAHRRGWVYVVGRPGSQTRNTGLNKDGPWEAWSPRDGAAISRLKSTSGVVCLTVGSNSQSNCVA